MLSQEIAIDVVALSKCYNVYHRPQDRLKQYVFPRLRRLFGRRPVAYFREFWALKDVSFRVHRGESIGIIGRNGSGKSTLLQMLCGTLTPTQGRIDINGRVAALLELGSGFNPEFTGRENVYLNASLLGLRDHEIKERIDDIIAFADIGDFIDQPVKTYSSGMYVRLAFAVIANVDADILVIDEALAVGDAFFVQKCMRFLRGFMKHGTLLFVSHDSGAVTSLCTRAVWLDKGSVQLEGSPKQVTERYLAASYATRYGEDVPVALTETSEEIEVAQDILDEPRDMRLSFINASNLRNDIELFSFQAESSSFGDRGASVTGAMLTDIDGQPLSWVVGGEDVRLVIRGIAHRRIDSAIVGFIIKDRLGQTLFGDNTFLTYLNQPVSIPDGKAFEARFDFRLPLLPLGTYSVGVAIAEGTQESHVQHHWLHDAFIFKSHATSVNRGLVGIPMRHISLGVLAANVQ